jgi:DUF2997 family protein
MPRIIEVTVSPKGDVTIETKGYTGVDCLRASKSLEQALGVPSSERKTAEFYQAQATEQNQVQQ